MQYPPNAVLSDLSSWTVDGFQCFVVPVLQDVPPNWFEDVCYLCSALFLRAVSVKNLSLRLMLIILTATDNVSQNVILEYAMMNSIFEAIMQVRR